MHKFYDSTFNESVKAALFLMNYANHQHLKILARIKIRDAKDAPELIEKLKIEIKDLNEQRTDKSAE